MKILLAVSISILFTACRTVPYTTVPYGYWHPTKQTYQETTCNPCSPDDKECEDPCNPKKRE